ncbi:MAG: M1 family aminopeptidase [Bacteroidia bacterium]
MTIVPDFNSKEITNTIIQHWVNTEEQDSIKLSFFPDFEILSVTSQSEEAVFKFYKADSTLAIAVKRDNSQLLEIHYKGKPHQALQPPWDGGFVWSYSKGYSPWLTLACQGIGSRLWWPSPIRYDDEPEQTKVSCIYPDSLFFKGNGKLISDNKRDGIRKTTWQANYPINTYNITLNIGNYEHWHDTLNQINNGVLSLDFYPLKENLEASKLQFSQAKPMIHCFEDAFGIFPFSKDGYSVVETDFAGMEHQTCIAYGNGYENGYLGNDYSGIGLPFDFILIHESAHEWWGNSISAKTAGDFWLQEAFCTYAEMVYVDCLFGEEKALQYINTRKGLVKNEAAILSPENHDADMYFKGALMIHTLSSFLDTKEQWRDLLKAFYQSHKMKSISSQDVFTWFSNRIDGCTPDFFLQYLNIQSPPQVYFKQVSKGDSTSIELKILNGIDTFTLPLYLINDQGVTHKIYVNKALKKFTLTGKNFKLDETKSYFIPKSDH